MAGLPQQRPVDYDDIVRLPEHVVGEIVDGQLHVSPRPTLAHALAASSLNVELGGGFRRPGPGGWWILHEPELHFGRDVVVPDLAGWRRERLPAVPKAPFLTLAPDWVCELLSPSTERLDRARKLPLYARQGVTHAWLVNPLARTLEVLRRQGHRWLVQATYVDDERVRAEPFEALELDLLSLWGETRPAAGAGVLHDAPRTEPPAARVPGRRTRGKRELVRHG
jgi:Uma2 family endonuclease